MTLLRAAAFAAILATLTACVNVDANEARKMPTDQLCENYYFTLHPAHGTEADWPTKHADIKKELERRQAIAPAEWPLIDQGHIEMGVSECALKASWGFPLRVTHTATAAGTSTHYIYTPARYADVTDGKVTGFSY